MDNYRMLRVESVSFDTDNPSLLELKYISL